MNRFLVALFLSAPFTLIAQGNQNYDPDYNGDGCYSIADILGLLPLFGECVEADTTWGCGDPVMFDGYWYQTVLIGEQCWFAENLRTTVYANGDSIPADLGDGEWTSTTAGAVAVYGEGISDCSNEESPDIDACDETQSLAEFGRLYNWYAVDDARGLCPAGWHVPSHEEWGILENHVASELCADTVATVLKAMSGWNTQYGWNGTDDFGFSALPGGTRQVANAVITNFTDAGVFGYWWSSTPVDGSALSRVLAADTPAFSWFQAGLRYGFSVRCLRDGE